MSSYLNICFTGTTNVDRRLGLQSHDLLEFFPEEEENRARRRGETKENNFGELTRVSKSISAGCYSIILFCVLPMLIFFMVWVFPLNHSTNLQDPSVPLSMMLAMLSLFWSVYLGSLHFGESH